MKFKKIELKTTARIKVNSVIFIESLANPNSTKKLYREEIESKCLEKALNHKYVSVKNKKELVHSLNILSKSRKKLFPIIHFASHGNEDGLKLIDDFITWEELMNPILELNISTENNLILNFASCSGSFGIGLYNKEKSPFHFMFGPSTTINEDVLENHLANFYKIFLTTFDIKEAFQLHEIKEQ
jgi:hypothetical protein